MQFFRRFSPDEAEMHCREGLRCLNRRKKEFNFSLAVEHFKKAIELNPEIGKYHYELGRAYVAAPLLAVTMGIGNGLAVEASLKLAVDELTQALQFAPHQAETYLVLGEAFMYLGKKQKAEEAFQAAIGASSFQTLSPSHFIDGLLLRSYAKRWLKYLERGTGRKSQPEAARECIERAISYRNDERYNLAERELMQAFELAPNWAWLHKEVCRLAG